jgi:hypothetical protein
VPCVSGCIPGIPRSPFVATLSALQKAEYYARSGLGISLWDVCRLWTEHTRSAACALPAMARTQCNGIPCSKPQAYGKVEIYIFHAWQFTLRYECVSGERTDIPSWKSSDHKSDPQAQNKQHSSVACSSRTSCESVGCREHSNHTCAHNAQQMRRGAVIHSRCDPVGTAHGLVPGPPHESTVPGIHWPYRKNTSSRGCDDPAILLKPLSCIVKPISYSDKRMLGSSCTAVTSMPSRYGSENHVTHAVHCATLLQKGSPASRSRQKQRWHEAVPVHRHRITTGSHISAKSRAESHHTLGHMTRATWPSAQPLAHAPRALEAPPNARTSELTRAWQRPRPTCPHSPR